MFKIRRGTFETNSSSCHSVTVECHRPNEMLAKTWLDPWVRNNFDNGEEVIEIELGEFGWEIEDYFDPYTKLQYLVTMAVETTKCETPEEFFESEDYKMIDEAIYNYTGYHIWLTTELKPESYTWDNGKVENYFSHDGYIDHQSCECYKSAEHFLIDTIGVADVIKFVFNENIVLHTDNDNY